MPAGHGGMMRWPLTNVAPGLQGGIAARVGFVSGRYDGFFCGLRSSQAPAYTMGGAYNDPVGCIAAVSYGRQ